MHEQLVFLHYSDDIWDFEILGAILFWSIRSEVFCEKAVLKIEVHWRTLAMESLLVTVLQSWANMAKGEKKKQEKLDKSRKLWCMPFDNFWLVVSKIHLLDLGLGCNLIQFWGTPKFLYLFRSQIYVVRPLMRQVYYTRYQARFTCGESNLYWNSKWHNYDDQHCSPETLLEKGLCCVSFVHNFATILRVGIYRIFSFIHVNGRFNSLIV